ncbi:MAG: hypothetical protein WBQ73_03880, partial [Candidatus Babeliales bacterium]
MKRRISLCTMLVWCLVLPMMSKEKGIDVASSTLTFPDGAIGLSQSDFDTGPYRIQTPGYYYLTEDISFNPTSPTAGANGIDGGRTNDRPRTGAWFTALSVETDNVVIDLNTYTIEVSEEFLANHEFKVFSLIELNNSPFPHLVFAYTGETELKAARNVVIKNGVLGHNPHHGIHGNNNVNIAINNIVCRDWEVAGISLNGLLSGSIKDVVISGIEHQVPFTGFIALINSALGELQRLINEGDQNAQPYYNDLAAYKAALAMPTHPEGTHDGNCFGIFLNHIVDVGPIATEYCADDTTNCICIENVDVCNIKAKLIETVGMKEISTGNLLKGTPFGIMRWQDAFDDEENFAPNAVLRAQAYVLSQISHAFPEHEPTQQFIDNILAETPSEAVFLNLVEPVFNIDFAGHTNKGVFGIRVDCGHGVTIKHCNVMGIE